MEWNGECNNVQTMPYLTFLRLELMCFRAICGWSRAHMHTTLCTYVRFRDKLLVALGKDGGFCGGERG